MCIGLVRHLGVASLARHYPSHRKFDKRHLLVWISSLLRLRKEVDLVCPGQLNLHAHDPIRYVGDMSAWVH